MKHRLVISSVKETKSPPRNSSLFTLRAWRGGLGTGKHRFHPWVEAALFPSFAPRAELLLANSLVDRIAIEASTRGRSMEPEVGDVTQLLKKWRAGDPDAESQLFRLVMPDLRRLAQYYISRERPDEILQPSALVNEAYLRLVRAKEQDWQSRQHFFAVAARAMRRYLIDYARARPKGTFVPFEDLAELLPAASTRLELALAIDPLLEELERIHPDLCSSVELKFFLGLTDKEAADALGTSLRSFQRRFSDARRWLFERLQDKNAARD